MKALPPLPSVSDIVRLYGLSAKQQLSQNFIMDLNLCRRIVRASGRIEGATVLEVGAGPGNLTRAVLDCGARHVVAVEKDERFLPALELLRAAAGPERMSIAHCDALTMDETALLRAAGAEALPWASDVAPVHVVGNLPFAVSTELLLKWIRQMPTRSGPFAFGRVPLTLLFQREVALRIVAPPGTEHSSRLSTMSQHCAQVVKRFDIDRRAFVPVPDVDTSVVSVVPLVTPLADVQLSSLEYVLRQVFGQRRKTLRNSVSTLEHGAEMLERSGVDNNKRADALTVLEWAALTHAFDAVRAERAAAGTPVTPLHPVSDRLSASLSIKH